MVDNRGGMWYTKLRGVMTVGGHSQTLVLKCPMQTAVGEIRIEIYRPLSLQKERTIYTMTIIENLHAAAAAALNAG